MEPGHVFAALSDPSRRRILGRLAQGPATSGQLADLFPVSRSAVSQHVRLLHQADVIRTTVVGRHRWHVLAPDTLMAASQWITELVARHAKAPVLRQAQS